MTQFMLCVPDPAAVRSILELRCISEGETWLSEIAHKIYPYASDVRVPYMKTGQTIGNLFTEAHNALYNKRDFETTKLESVLLEMMNTCQSFALWWGDEWSDLPVVDTEAALRSEIISQLQDSVGDVYLRWIR